MTKELLNLDKMLRQATFHLLLIGFLAGTSRAYFRTQWLADGNLFEPIYSYDDADIVPDNAHRLRISSYEESPTVVTTQELVDSTSSMPPEVPEKSLTRIESNGSAVVAVEEVKSERKELKAIEGRHISGLENYYQKLRNSLGQDNKYNFLSNKLSGNLLQRSNEEQGHLASLVTNGRRIRSKNEESPETATTVNLVELGPTVNETNLIETSNSRVIEYDIHGQLSVEWMHKHQVLFVENRKQLQMNAFGNEVDLSEILRQEAVAMACGPRNYLERGAEDGTGKQPFGEFPSHAGIYVTNSTVNTSANNMNFLCGATWYHERFVLTLASCLEKVEPDQLIVRLGEWNIARRTEEHAMVMSRVDKVFKFSQSMLGVSTHNLALLRLALPSSQLDYRNRLTYLTPACVPDSRNPNQKQDCRVPGRSTTNSEYLDLDGDGEIEMQQSVEMVEQPMDMQCYNPKLLPEIFIEPALLCAKPMDKIKPKVNLIGSGVYCNDSGLLVLRSIVQTHYNGASLIDLTFYQPWLRNITLGNG